MRTISLRLDATADAMLRSLCERLDATQTEVVLRALVLLASSATPAPGALGLELGLVGAFAGGGHSHAAGHSEGVKAHLAAKREEEQRRNERTTTTDKARGTNGTPRTRQRRGPKS